MVKMKEHDIAIKLRKEGGKSLLEISKTLKISKGTASVWCKNIVLSEEQLKQLKRNQSTSENTIIARHKNIKVALKVMQENRRLRKLQEDPIKKECRRSEQKKRAINKYSIKRRIEYKTKCIEYKGGKCMKCGYDKCSSAMDFHHKDPSIKDFDIGRSVTIKVNWNNTYKELDKCDLLCCRCHREIHDEIVKEKYKINNANVDSVVC